MTDSQENICQVCGKGTIEQCIEMTLVKHKDRTAMLPLHFVKCNSCTSDYAGNVESKINKNIVLMFRRMVDDQLGE